MRGLQTFLMLRCFDAAHAGLADPWFLHDPRRPRE